MNKKTSTGSNKKKKHLLFWAISAALVIVIIIGYCFFQRTVTIYEPVIVRIKEISPDDACNIDIKGITPLNREISFLYSETLNAWNINYCFLKGINIVIGDTLAQKVKTLEIVVKQKSFIIAVKDLQAAGHSGSRNEYHFPSCIHSEDSFIKRALSVFHWSITASLLKILFILSFILILIFFFKRLLKNRNTSFREVLSNIKITVKQNPNIRKVLLWFRIIVFSVLFACILFFGYMLFKYHISTYYTAISFILFTGILLWYLAEILVRIFRISTIHHNRIKWIIPIFIIIWFCTETYLRVKEINMSFSERSGYFYKSGFYEKEKADEKYPQLIVYKKNYCFIDQSKEFSYEVKANAEGLRDIDHPVEKEKEEYRIVCIGNSFTEGIGAPQDSTWPKLLEDKLKSSVNRKVTVFNAGKAGSDPFFEYMLLKEKILKFKPNLVLLTLGTSDFNFYRFRGGFERFTPNDYHYREAPDWEIIYAVSYICRFATNNLMHYKYFLRPAEYKADSIKALNDYSDCIRRFYDLSVEKKFRFVVVFYDDAQDRYFPIMNDLKKKNIIPVIDLFEYNKHIEKLSQNKLRGYRWPLDGHFNSKGYNLLARGVEWNLKKMGIIDSLNAEH
jgi:lysophospholipase L1-like esterase